MIALLLIANCGPTSNRSRHGSRRWTLPNELPTGTALTSEGLDQAFSRDTWSAKAYLVPDDRTLVLVAIGT
ncbi:hypothetical protein ABZ345_25720 [Lentzea sp. NPDC005914]|uniref:hypothetical protein n=1 Tax=Lentzea sp. NPDC005914 TaxID=3154572 RepID=UPI0033DE69FB